MLVHRCPYPPNKGDKIRSFHVLSHLARTHEVWLACLIDDADDLRHMETLERIARRVAVSRIDGRLRRIASLRALWPPRSITVTHFHCEALQRRIDDWIDGVAFDGVLCCSAAMAEYVNRSRHLDGRLRGSVKVMDLIDVDSCKWGQYAQGAWGPLAWLYRREALCLAEYERRIVRDFDRVFLVSDAEARLLDHGTGPSRVGAFSNGVDLEYFAPRRSDANAGAEPSPLLVFTGVMDYLPNVQGATWFAESVLPIIRRSMPEVRVAIVGSRPSAPVRRLASLSGVTVTGYVEDVRDWIARAAVCIAPLRIARGIQNKVLEAMAMGRPVVATPEAFEGIDATPGRELVVAGDARAFAEAVLELLRDRARAAEIGRAGRACVERRYRWERNLAVLDEVFG